MVKAGLEAIYLSGWQVAADANLVGADVSGPEPLSGELRPRARAADLERAPAGRPDRPRRGRRREVLARAHRGRCRGGLRRAAERVRADEGLHRGRRGRGAFRGPALVGEEVRPPRRQGARPDEPVRPDARRRAARGRRARRPDDDRRAHRRALRLAPHERRRRADRELCTGERTAEGFFRVRDGIEAAIARGLAYAPYADLMWCETSTPDMDEAERFAAAIHERHPGQAARVQLLAVVQLAAAPRRRADRDLPAGPRPHGLPVPVHHAGRVPRAQPLDVRARERLPRRRDDRLRLAAGARVRARGGRLHRDAPPARGRRRLLRPGDRRPSRAARRRPSP